MLETRFTNISHHLLVYSVDLPVAFRLALTKKKKKAFLELINFFVENSRMWDVGGSVFGCTH